MNIMELGAIGGLGGGVAVIGSLIDVGLQVGQSNEHANQSVAMALCSASVKPSSSISERVGRMT